MKTLRSELPEDLYSKEGQDRVCKDADVLILDMYDEAVKRWHTDRGFLPIAFHVQAMFAGPDSDGNPTFRQDNAYGCLPIKHGLEDQGRLSMEYALLLSTWKHAKADMEKVEKEIRKRWPDQADELLEMEVVDFDCADKDYEELVKTEGMK